jgi:hypothetical protein
MFFQPREDSPPGRQPFPQVTSVTLPPSSFPGYVSAGIFAGIVLGNPGSQGIPRIGESGESQSFIISTFISTSFGSDGACVFPERPNPAADYD